jgi:hypothetical protein
MAGFLSTEIPIPLRRRISKNQLRQKADEQEDEPLLLQLSRQEQQQQHQHQKLEKIKNIEKEIYADSPSSATGEEHWLMHN